MPKAILSLLLAVLLALPATGFAAAQEAETPPCEGDQVTGTVVAVDDATGTVTIDTGDGLCSVDVDDDDGSYVHPMLALLGAYFGSTFDTTGLGDALEAVEGCALQDAETEAWTWVACGTEDAVQVVVTGDNQDGTFAATADGEEIDVVVDDTLIAQSLSDALAEMNVDWELNGDGGLSQVGSQIASYHEDGLGFGVLTKLFAMAAESQEACADPIDGDTLGEVSADGLSLGVADVTETCGVAVDDLVTAFRSGTGMGQLFKEYGKPSILGVGHVRKAQQQLDAAESTEESLTEEATTPLESQTGNGNGKGNGAARPQDGDGNGRGGGNGQGNGNGQGGGSGRGKGKP